MFATEIVLFHIKLKSLLSFGVACLSGINAQKEIDLVVVLMMFWYRQGRSFGFRVI